jgi:multidrug efflux pump subunit AcrB
MPKVEYDRVTARVVLPFGESVEETKKVRDRLMKAADEVLAEHDEKDIHLGVFTQIGYERSRGGPGAGAPSFVGSHLTTIEIRFVGSGDRKLTMSEFAKLWREKAGPIPGLEGITFHYSSSASAGSPIDVQLAHHDLALLESAAEDLSRELGQFDGVTDIDDGFAKGKRQTNLVLTEEGKSAGLTAKSLGRQLRDAFFGAEAIRQQRGRDELRVYVRLPRKERESKHTLDNLILRTPEAKEMPLSMAADQSQDRSYTSIRRVGGQRVINVTADVITGVANGPKVLAELKKNALPQLLHDHPGLEYSLEGENSATDESLESLGIGYVFALLVIFGLLAIPFRSYLQPIVVMSAIPFGIVGALIGHVVMGFDMSIISLMGIVALSGVVVNDSLVLVDAANNNQRDGMSAIKAIESAGIRRFRPIFLTSLTTFFGLAPMIFETSVQARFLVPMAISLGFGILYATLIILLFVPVVYSLIESYRALFRVPDREEPANASTLAT